MWMAQKLVIRVLQIQKTQEDQIRVSKEISTVSQWPIHRVVRDFILEGRVRMFTGYVQGRNSYHDIAFAVRKELKTRTREAIS